MMAAQRGTDRPARLTPKQLTEDAGAALAAKLMARWAGHEIPKLTDAYVSRETRNAQLREMFDATGGDVEAVSIHFGLHPRHVQRIVNGA